MWKMSNIFINIWLCFVKAVFTFLHFVYSSLHFLDLSWTVFKRKWESAIFSRGINPELYVSQFVTGLSNCPSHVAVIVGNDEIACQDFTNLVVWCLAAGISFLTVYDQKGLIKQQEEKLTKYLFANTMYSPQQIRFSNVNNKSSNGSNGYKNKLYINVMSYADGCGVFVDVVKQAATLISSGLECRNVINPDIISEELYRRTKFPDPDLAIVVAPELCTYGFPPWSIRLTEFIQIPTVEQMNVTEFCDILDRYAKCEKRVGK